MELTAVRNSGEKSEQEQFLTKSRSRRLPALLVGEESCTERSKEWNSGRKAAFWEASRWMLKSPRRISGVPSSGKELRRVSSSSRKLPRGPGGR